VSKALAIFGGATLVYAILAILMGVLPGVWLSQVPPTPGLKPLTPVEARGRDIYVSEGCYYCHTQQVRPLSGDGPFGRPSAPGDYAYQTPELLGSERNGPDLSNVGVRQASTVWQYIHLFEPRAVVPQSIMPAYPWLFRVVDKAPQGEQPVPLPAAFAPANGVVVPSEEGKALVAYLLSLKQPRITLAAAPGGAAAPAPAATGEAGFDAEKGATLFANHCASCHGADGKGVAGAFPPLAGDPIVNAADPVEHVSTVLHGAQGRTIGGQTYTAAMPGFAEQLSDADIADIIDHERTSWGNHGPLVNRATVAAVRLNKPPPAPAPATTGASGALGAAATGSPAPTAAGASRTEGGAAAKPANFDAAQGAKLYADTCAACHGAEGKGVAGAFPPLAGDPVVNAADAAEHIDTVLHGAQGRTINGQTYASPMPPFAGQLSDPQIADIIGHERTSWGNRAPLVSPADVAARRARK
jgi:cytochrome c oxidase cbb3-type subunit 2